MMRFGGDEFVIFGADATKEGTESFAKELNDYIDELNNKNCLEYSQFGLNTSTGIIAIDNGNNLSFLKLIDRANKDMYAAKQKKKDSSNDMLKDYISINNYCAIIIYSR